MNRQELLRKLTELKPKVAARYNVMEMGLFGSFVRGEQGEASDVDILVDFEEQADLFDLVGLALFLEEELRQRVDIVPKKALRAELRESVLREVMPL